MRLRRRLTKLGPRVEISYNSDWLPLHAVERFPEIAGDLGLPDASPGEILPILRLGPEGWRALTQELTQALTKSPAAPPPEGRLILPVPPCSFRDFMLYEQHAVAAARGMARRFLPTTYRFVRAIEMLTHRPFPGFRPHRLWSAQPIYYLGNHLNFLTEGQQIPWPSYTSALDYELELGAVLAHPLRNASPDEAASAIGGFVVLNDLSARDVQLEEMRSGFGPQKAKHFANAMSAELVTSDEILPRLNTLRGSVMLNGHEVSRCSTENPRHSLPEAIAFASRDEPLHPGELFGSGTLPGGSGLETGNWMQPGDRLTLTIEGVGSISATVGERRRV